MITVPNFIENEMKENLLLLRDLLEPWKTKFPSIRLWH